MTSNLADTARQTLRIGHSPDPDDAFMWYPLANFTAPDGEKLTPKIDTRGYDFVHVLEDIQSLNERSLRGELEITAISIHQYPFVAGQYALTSCGSSMGDGYGPMIVARKNLNLADFIKAEHASACGSGSSSDHASAYVSSTSTNQSAPTLAIPGHQTTAWLATQLMVLETLGGGQNPTGNHTIRHQVIPFDQIIPRVAAGEFDAGLIIHEGQITYHNQGLKLIADLGQWWTSTRNLPLPLGGNCIRRDLGDKMPEICAILLDSIQYALDHRDQAVRFALNYARDMGSDLADEFVGMYVNNWTLDYGDRGRAAVQQLIKEAIDAGLVPDCGPIDFIQPN